MGMEMNITVTQQDDLMIVAVQGRLDSEGSTELENWSEKTFDPPGCDVIMDFSRLDYISSAGLRTILNLSKLMKKYSRKFSICGAQAHVKEVLEISGFDTFIPLYKSVDDYLS